MCEIILLRKNGEDERESKQWDGRMREERGKRNLNRGGRGRERGRKRGKDGRLMLIVT